MTIESFIIGSRASPLARIQVQEVIDLLLCVHPKLTFEILYTKTKGDLDLLTSLRGVEKTDFFTHEIDQWVIKKICRVGIHSAKDLPDPLPEGLKLICLTEGVDPSDSLVIPPGETLASLKHGAIIGTSSLRREEAARQLRDDFTFIDLRGTIEQRLMKIETKEADGVIIAEAALIRLKKTDLNRLTLPGSTVPGQGQLAVIARADDKEIEDLFSPLDCRLKSVFNCERS